MTDFDLPPKRALPPEVRARMRATVEEEMRPNRRGGRWMFAVAAAVVLLVLGAVSLTQQIKSPQVPAAGDAAAGLADRCWSAMRTAGKTFSVAARPEWVVSSTETNGDDAITAFRAGEQRMFCATTATSVTVSDPHAAARYAPDGKTALLLATKGGLAAGITDPDTYQGMDLYRDGIALSTSSVTTTGEFVTFTGLDLATAKLSSWGRKDGTREKPGELVGTAGLLPPVAQPLVNLVDRPGDRTSPAGAALGQCLAKVADRPANADAYAPGVLLQSGPFQVVLGRLDVEVVACTSEPDPVTPGNTIRRLYSGAIDGLVTPVKTLRVDHFSGDGAPVPFVGMVPKATAAVVTDVGVGHRIDVGVAGGTFGMWLPADAKSPAGNGTVWVQAENPGRRPFYSGWIPLS